MKTLVRGIHHITLCPCGAQDDVDFFTRVLAQRLIKQTVLMDGGIPVYHLYYGNADADVGSIATSFPYSRKKGRPGSGQLSETMYSVPKGSAPFWADHCARYDVEHSGVLERFGRRYVRVRHPAGLSFEMMEVDADARRPWTTAQVGTEVAARGFFGAVLSVRDVCEQEAFFVEAMGLRTVGVDGPYHRFAIGAADTSQMIDLLHEPDRAPGTWGFGAGTAHHIAFEVESDEALVEQKAIYEELGFTDASEVKDRYYFHSMYVRSPGGILVECTSNVEGGFYQDESPEELGTRLHLPPWYEEQQQHIVSMLEPIVVPESNRPKDGRTVARSPRPATPAGTTIPTSRTKPDFVRKKH